MITKNITLRGRFVRRGMAALLCGLCMLLPTVVLAQKNITAAFTDANFKAAVYGEIGKTAPAAIYDTDVNGITWLTVSEKNISSLAGIEYFTGLEIFWCEGNQLTALDVSGCTNLQRLECSGNQLTTLDVSGLTSLETLSCYDNQLTQLDVSGCTNLQRLECSGNQLTTLDVSGLTSLETLSCVNNQLTALDVSGSKNLQNLYCYGNQLTALNLTGSGLTATSSVYCYYNNMTWTADVTGWIGGEKWVFYPQNAASLGLYTDRDGNGRIDESDAPPVTSTRFASGGGTQTFGIRSNLNWTASSSAPWLRIAPVVGADDYTFTVTATANPGYTRTDSIVVNTGGIVRILTVTQDAAQQIVVEPEPPVGNRGTIEVALEIPINADFTATFTLRLPAGFVLDTDATSLVSGLLSRYRLVVTPTNDGGWLFEIAPQTGLRSGGEEAYQKVVNIAYTINAESVPAGAYAAKLTDVSLAYGGETVRRDEITAPIHVTATGNATIDATEITFANGLLTVNTPVAEQITVYSVSGARIYSAPKDAGRMTFDLSRLAKGVYIVTGESWAEKIVNSE